MAMNHVVSYKKKILGRILISFLLFVVFAAGIASYGRFFIYQDFPVTVETTCDPASESCFVHYCDPKFEECTGRPEEDTWYYKRITRQGNVLPSCISEKCAEVSCAESELACEVEFCDPESEEECSDRDTFPHTDTKNKVQTDKSTIENGVDPNGKSDLGEMAEKGAGGGE